MSDKRTVVRVSIVGEEYTIRTDESLEHTKAVAQFVDQAIRDVLKGAIVVESHKAAILAALQITDQLFKARLANRELTTRVRDLSAAARAMMVQPDAEPAMVAEPVASVGRPGAAPEPTVRGGEGERGPATVAAPGVVPSTVAGSQGDGDAGLTGGAPTEG